MNEEVIKNYEADFLMFCRLAAMGEIDQLEYIGDISEGIFIASIRAFKLAANQMYFRLEQAAPDKYPSISLECREFIIIANINTIIKERSLNVKKT